MGLPRESFGNPRKIFESYTTHELCCRGALRRTPKIDKTIALIKVISKKK